MVVVDAADEDPLDGFPGLILLCAEGEAAAAAFSFLSLSGRHFVEAELNQ